MEVFDIRKFDEYREDNRREVKKAQGGVPNSLWETYSSMANCYGGVIILGVVENPDGSFYTTGLKNAARMKKNFWDTINNQTKVSINLLTDENVVTYDMNSDVIMVLDHGRIIERGSHDQLIAEKGQYYQLYTGAFELE